MSNLDKRVAELSPEKRQWLLQQLQKKKERALKTGIQAQKRDMGSFPLSFAQQRLWFFDQLAPESTLYLIPGSRHVSGLLHVEALERSLTALIRRHESLRTTFEMQGEQPVQIIHPALPAHLPLIDLQGLAPARSHEVARHLTEQEARRPCDLRQGPLLRVSLVRLDAKEHILLMTMHHIISDGWSFDIFQRELEHFYQSFVAKSSLMLPPLPVQYADFAVWQRQWLQGEVLEQQLDYWERQLADVPVIDLPTDYPRPPVQTYRGTALSARLPQTLHSRLVTLAQHEGVSLFTLLLAAFMALLARYTGQSDLAIGTPVTNRTRPELEGIIGFFVNMLVLRGNLAGNPSFLELLKRVKETALAAYAHQDVPFEQLVETMLLERDASRSPLFQALFALEQLSTTSEGDHANSQSALALQRIGTERTTTRYEFALIVTEAAHECSSTIEYNTDLYSPDTIQRMLAHWETLLEGIVQRPESSLADLPLLPASERHRLLATWNMTRPAKPEIRSLPELFDVQAEVSPDAIAVVDAQGCLSYAYLQRRASQMARYLQAQGVGPEVLVGVLVERSALVALSLLAILKAGGGYVPLDPAYPRERLSFILEETGMPLLLTHSSRPPVLPDSSHLRILVFSQLWEQLPASAPLAPASEIAPEQAAYVIYTSGSTGQPKGVLVTHRGIGNLAQAQRQWLGLGARDRVLQFCSLSFDGSIFEMTMALLSGACLHFAPQERLLPGPDLLALLEQWAITTMGTPPSMLTLLPYQSLPTVQTLIMAGEATRPELIARWSPGRHLYDSYGPTETTVCATMHEYRLGDENPCIGRPIFQTRLYVLDSSGQPVPQGVAGELFIGGVSLARGYLKRAELTAQRFVPDPFAQEPGARLYRTGDRVRYRADGSLQFLGRLDEQVKLRGYRIEVGEIEAALRSHPLVHECIVLVKDTAGNTNDKLLVAYVVVAEEALQQSISSFSTFTGTGAGAIDQPASLDAEYTTHISLQLYNHLHAFLPNYMVPASFIVLDRFPLTPNGKADRKALLALEAHETDTSLAMEAPRTLVEDVLVEIWCGLLGRSRVGIHDNFFQLGGHSLLATQLVSRIRTVLAVDLPLRKLFEFPTIAQQAALVEQAMQQDTPHRLPPLQPQPRPEAIPLSFAQQRIWFLQHLDRSSPAYLIPSAQLLSGPLDVAALHRSLTTLLARHESLRTTFPQHEGQPIQRIQPASVGSLPLIDLSGLAHQRRLVVSRQLARQEATMPCDLGQGPVLRTTLLRLGMQEHVFLQTMHHIISDALSNEVFMRELTLCYHSYASGQAVTLPPLPIQYADFALWQRQWLQGELLQEQLDYWRQRLAGVATLELPTDHPRPALQTARGALLTHRLPAPLGQQLHALSQQQGVTLFMLLLASFQILLARYSGQEDIAVGTPIANRTDARLEGLIGFFVNTLVLRSSVRRDLSFLQVLEQVREGALEAYRHQDVPFEQLVEVLQPQRQLNRAPLFQVMFSVQQQATTEAAPAVGLHSRELSTEHLISKFDLTVTALSHERGIECSAEYSTDLFEAETMQRLLQHWQVLLEGIVTAPQMPVAYLPLLTESEQQQVAQDWSGAAVASAAEQSNRAGSEPALLLTLFAQQVAVRPDAVALVSGEQVMLSYGEVERRANQLAHYLRERGVGPEVLVGVASSRSAAWLISLLAVLKAGGGYVPLDPAYPGARLAFMLADTRIPVLLVEQASLLAPELTEQTSTIDLSAIWLDLQRYPTSAPRQTALLDNVAYVIYTSGSTGVPKGVAVTHRGLGNLAGVQAQAFALSPQSHVLQFASQSFDASVAEVVVTFLAGASLYLFAQASPPLGRELLDLLREWAISTVTLPPSALRTLPVEPLPTLETLVVAGESCPADLAAQWAAHRRFCNAYGPTETTVCSTIALTDSRSLSSTQVSILMPSEREFAYPNIGTPIANTEAYVLDSSLQLLPAGVPGELYLGGLHLARGYLRRADETAARFVPHPFSQHAGARLYRTGDRVRYRADGSLEFLGRLDQQIKLRGYRIEVGEIEAIMQRHPAVQSAVVLLRQEPGSEPVLVSYLLAAAEETLPAQSVLSDFVRLHAPEYMVPSFFVWLDAYPLNVTGKIDRQQLLALDPRAYLAGLSASQEEEAIVQPRDAVEFHLVQIWQEVLQFEPISITDNFFDLGGHSIIAVRLMAQVAERLGQDLPLSTLFQHPTIAQLAREVEQAMREQATRRLPPLLAQLRPPVIPLSFAQQRIWFLQHLDLQSPAYLIPLARLLQGDLVVAALQHSLETLLARHESLRTTFPQQDGQPIQYIHSAQVARLPLIDLSGLPQARQNQCRQQLARQEATMPCDLEQGPLLRTTLLRLGIQEHVFLLTMHHIISDALSNEVFMRELTQCYHGYANGQAVTLPPLPIQYADFALWQRQWLQGALLREQLDYWKERLAGVATLELPADHQRPPVLSTRGALLKRRLSAPLRDQLIALAQQQGVTLFMLLLASFQILLARYSGQEDIAVGTPIANRTDARLEGLIGFFVNTLVLRSSVRRDLSFLQVLEQVREGALEAYRHQDVPFEQLVEVLQPQRQLNRAPLFQVMFSVQQQAATEAAPAVGLHSRELSTEHLISKFDLTVTALSHERGIECSAEYSTDLFEAETMQRLLQHWQMLLEGIVAEPRSPIAVLPLLSEQEQQQLREWSIATQQAEEQAGEASLPELFEAQARVRPDAIAVVDAQGCLSYAYLQRRTSQMAGYLRGQGVGPEVLVGVLVERSALVVLSLLAILKAGGGYVPLDPAYPQERLSFIVGETAMPLLLAHTSVPTLAAVLASDQAPRVLPLSQLWEQLPASAPLAPASEIAPGQTAYVIYTSGSTGQPKGVVVTHRGIDNLAQAQQQWLRVDAPDRVLQLCSLSFDASIFEMVMGLLSGACLHFAPQERLLPGPDLLRVLEEWAITKVVMPPSMLEALPHHSLPALSTLIMAGEASHTDLIARWSPGRHLFDAYGPTETTVWASIHEYQSGEEQPCIGRPISRTRLYVLDSSGQPVPQGVAGELFIGGISLARGYLKRAELTAQRFVPDPFAQELGARLYRTGDRVRYRADGTLQFLGRLDQQVKLRGYRIEVGEIEAIVQQHPAVQSAVVLLRQEPGSEPSLVAYLLAANEETLPAQSALSDFVRLHAPEYMVPSFFVLLDAYPLSVTGKIDRQQLLALDPRAHLAGSAGVSASQEEAIVQPRDAIEFHLLQIWQEVLQLEPISITDNFFDLGGHSIIAVRLMARIAERLGQDLPLSTLFQHPTIAQLAPALRQPRPSEAHPILVPLQPEGTMPPFFCVHPSGGTVFCYVNLARCLGQEQPFYGLQSPELVALKGEALSIEELAAHYVAAIQTVQPAGPYVLGGWSSGGVVAFEMAQQLQRQGYEVALLAIIDSTVPSPRSKEQAPLELDDTALAYDLLGHLHVQAPDNFVQLVPEEQLQYALEQAKVVNEVPMDTTLGQIRHIIRMKRVNTYITRCYQPQQYQGHIDFFYTTEMPPEFVNEAERIVQERIASWAGLTTRGLSTHEIPGNHEDMVEEPDVQILAQAIGQRINEVLHSDPVSADD